MLLSFYLIINEPFYKYFYELNNAMLILIGFFPLFLFILADNII